VVARVLHRQSSCTARHIRTCTVQRSNADYPWEIFDSKWYHVFPGEPTSSCASRRGALGLCYKDRATRRPARTAVARPYYECRVVNPLDPSGEAGKEV